MLKQHYLDQQIAADYIEKDSNACITLHRPNQFGIDPHLRPKQQFPWNQVLESVTLTSKAEKRHQNLLLHNKKAIEKIKRELEASELKGLAG